MSKTLLTTSKNTFFKGCLTVSLKITLVVLFLTASLQNTTAQCIGPYQKVEGFPVFATEAAAFADLTAQGWIFENLTTGLTTGFTRNTSGTYNRSGNYSFRQLANNINARITTPAASTPATFAFWIKKASAVTTYVLEVSDDDGVTWYPLVNGANSLFGSTLNAVVPVMTTTWQQVSVTGTIGANNAFPASASGYRFRITDDRVLGTNGIIVIDDFSWTSSVPAQNTIILPYTSTTSSCPFTIQDGITYTFYDNGGNDNYSASQLANDIILTPANAASKIKIEFEEFNISTNAGNSLSVFNSNNYTSLLNTYNGAALPANIVSSAVDGSLSFQMRSASAAAFTNTGYKIKVTAVQCNNPSGFVGTAGPSSANLSWTGSGAATDYEIFQATSATPVPVVGSVGTLTGSTTPTYTATGLTPGTNYYYWVRSICGSEKSAWVGPVLVKPVCNPVTVPYLEDFNGYASGTLPPCTSSIAAGAWGCNAANGNIFTNTDGASFFSKGVTLTAGTTYRIYYDYRNINITTNPVTGLEVFIGTTNSTPTASNITGSIAYHDTTIFYQTETLNYTPGVTGTYYLRFLLDYASDPSVALNVDNVRIEEETCFRPNFGAGNSNASPYVVFPAAPDSDYGATISWNTPVGGQPSNGYDYFLSTTNTPPTASSTPTGSVPFNTNSVTFNTLTQNTSYYFWIRSNCGSGLTSLWSVYYAYFTTTNINTNSEVLITKVEPTNGAPGLNYEGGCNFTFFDGGGSTGDYANDINDQTYTFRPAVAGRKLKVVFSSFNTENNYDGLVIYSGDDSIGNTRALMSSGRAAGTNTTTCPAGAYSGTTSPGTIISTATNGSLSFTFRSDYSVVRSGWSATITCVLVPTIASFTPLNNSCGTAGVLVTLTGTNFTGTTGVTFGGVPAASFTVVSATQITATVPAAATTGKIRVIKPDAFADSATNFEIQQPGPTTTPLSICVGGTGDLLATSSCNGTPTNVITGALTASSPTAARPLGGTTCTISGVGTNAYYTATQFTVTVSGTYAFQTNNAGTDFFGYITSGPFVPGSCGSGTFILGNDDGAGSLQPLLSVNLTVGTVYTLYTTTFGNGVIGAYNWTIATPVGGGISIGGLGQPVWYTAATGGSAIYTGSNFNPVGVAGSGVSNNTTPVNITFYAACSTNPNCRTATNYTIVDTTPGTASSDQNVCLGSAADVVLTGNGAPVTRWQYNDSDITFATGTTVNIPASASTTLTSAQIGTFAGTRYYRAEITVGSCTSFSNVITISFSSVSWNGSAWSNGTGPTASIGAIFNGNYSSSASLSACSVVVNSGNVVFNTGHTLTVVNTVNVVGGTLTFEDESSLYQTAAVTNAPGVYSGGNTGNIVYRRTSEAMFREDYTYWSTPVNPQNLLAVSPTSPQNFFLTYNGTAWTYVTPSSTTMTVAKGYLVRAPLGFNLGSPDLPGQHTVDFSGTPNNGSQTISVVGGSSQLNLLGNPYPSALSAFPTSVGAPETGFVSANSNLNGSLYFWTHNTHFGVYAWGQYNPNDYAIYNYSGGSTAGPLGSGNNTVPNGLIASGQGFFVEGLSSGTASFTNAMRRATGNDNFYRTNQASQSVENNLEKHRYWLEVTNDNFGFKQVLIGYIEGATNGLDRLYDAKMVDYSNPVSIYTKINDTKLTIQGKDLAFDVNEIIPLCFEALTSSNFTIKLSDFDGLFLNQNIYLEDTTLNIIHDLKQSPYIFASVNGLFENRFKVRYTTNALGVNDAVFNENSVVVYKDEQVVNINSGSVNMKNVTIYDIAGRLIASKSNINNVSTSFINLPQAQQVLLVKIESEDGKIVTKKVVF